MPLRLITELEKRASRIYESVSKMETLGQSEEMPFLCPQTDDNFYLTFNNVYTSEGIVTQGLVSEYLFAHPIFLPPKRFITRLTSAFIEDHFGDSVYDSFIATRAAMYSYLYSRDEVSYPTEFLEDIKSKEQQKEFFHLASEYFILLSPK